MSQKNPKKKKSSLATAAARTVVADVEGIATASQRAGMPIEVYSFIGSSPIRHYAESWDLEFLLGNVRRSTEAAVRAGLPFCLVTEDTTRANPDVLRALFRTAIDAGAVRLCLCDTTGHVTPYGVEELIAFTRTELAAMGATHVEKSTLADGRLNAVQKMPVADEGPKVCSILDPDCEACQ